jgi:NitT/TauT family transport system ATP-binding protein
VNSLEPIIELQEICLDYENAFQKQIEVLNQISFNVLEGEKIAIIGPSGCGKSSLLSLISGIRKPTAGKILYCNQEVTKPSHERVIIFQNYALFPWKTSLQNIEFAIRSRGYKGNSRNEALRYLSMMNLVEFSDSYPNELSGGMQQRIGIARALAAHPQVLLLDEPFASLDSLTKTQVLDDVLSVVSKLKITVIMVTHSIEEAIFISNKVIVLSERPSRILRTIDINFDKPETLTKLKLMEQYINYESQIQEILAQSMIKENK